jgi:hypothetical protein
MFRAVSCQPAGSRVARVLLCRSDMPRRRAHWKSSGVAVTLLALITGIIAMIVIALPRSLERSDAPPRDLALATPAQPQTQPTEPQLQTLPADASAPPAPQVARDEAGEADDTVDRQYVLGLDPMRPVPSLTPGRTNLVLNRDAGPLEGERTTAAPAGAVSAPPPAPPVAESTDLLRSADAGTSPARRAPTPAPEATHGEPEPCGMNVCAGGTICCNESCGTCVAPGQSCSKLTCSMPEVPVSVMCGRNTCSVGEVCCNLSCGICAAPGAACDQRICD